MKKAITPYVVCLLTIIFLSHGVEMYAGDEERFHPKPAAFDAVDIVKSPVVMRSGRAYRRPGLRVNAPSSETAVLRCLRWFKATQNDDGAWGDTDKQKPINTALVLLAYLSRGETPVSHEFGETVEDGIRFLVSAQNEKGTFVSGDGTMREHGIVTWALCETYGMTRLPKIRVVAERAVDVIVSKQKNGLWVQSDETSDMEASVWNSIALKASHMSGVERSRSKAALMETGEAMKAHLGTNPANKENAPIIHAMQLIGFSKDLVVRTAVAGLEGIAINWEHPEFQDPLYYWYFTTKAKFYLGGAIWNEWHKSYVPVLVKNHIVENGKNGMKVGHWLSPGKEEGDGNVYTSALCCLMLGNFRVRCPTFQKPIIEPDEIEDEENIDIEIEI